MKIAVLGSTGSIGTQTLQVVRELNSRQESSCNPHFEIIALAAGSNVELLAEQAIEFNVSILSVKTPEDALKLKNIFKEQCISFNCRSRKVTDLCCQGY